MAKDKKGVSKAIVIAVLKKAGYELPDFKGKGEKAEFILEHGYDPDVVINSTMRMAEVFPKDWKKRISPILKEDEDEAE